MDNKNSSETDKLKQEEKPKVEPAPEPVKEEPPMSKLEAASQAIQKIEPCMPS